MTPDPGISSSGPDTDPASFLYMVRHPLVLGLTAAIIAAMFWPASESAPKATAPLAVPSQGSADFEAACRAAQPVVAAFLSASTTEARAALIKDSARLRPVMEGYYQNREVEPINAADFQPAPWRINGPNGAVAVLHAPRSRSLPAIIACVSQENGQWLLDWETFIQTADGNLGQFIDQAGGGLQTFRVRATRTSAKDQPVVLSLADPFGDRALTLPVTRPDLVAILEAGLPAGQTRTATIEVGWISDTVTGGLVPRVTRHVCWGFQGLDGQPAVPAPAATEAPGTSAPGLTANPPPAPEPVATPPPAATVAAAARIAVETPAASSPGTKVKSGSNKSGMQASNKKNP